VNITTSPDINVLDFDVLFDISVATPTITLTNASSGPDLASCTWWYTIMAPNGNFIHKGSEGTPDISGTWTTEVMPDTWPQPYGQIQWSGNDYIVILYVKDGVGNIYSQKHQGAVCRPNGSTPKSIGNFGESNATATVKCNDAQLYAQDTTDYTYQGLSGTGISQTWTLVYPPAADGSIPAPVTVTNQTSVLFDLGYSSPGYNLVLNTVREYELGDNVTVKIQYKFRYSFAVQCNIDLCPLVCEVEKYIREVNDATCGAYQDPAALQKLATINALMTKLLIAKQQPLCGIDMAPIIEEIQNIGGFSCDCITAGGGILPGGDPTGDIVITIEPCGDIKANVNQTGNNFQLVIKDYTYILELDDAAVDAGFSWEEEVDDDNCTKTWTLKYSGSIGGGCPSVITPIYVHLTSDPPDGCPTPVWPQDVYNVADDTVIGTANDITELVGILNADTDPMTGWRGLYGVAIAIDPCHVWFPCYNNEDVPIPPVHVESADGPTPCIDTDKTFETQLQDYNVPGSVIPSINYPGNFYVQYASPGTIYSLGVILNYADLISALNAQPDKPANISFSASSGANPNTIKKTITDVTCMQVDTVTIFQEVSGTVSIGSNSDYLNAVSSAYGIEGVDTLTDTGLGRVCGVLFGNDIIPWHMIRRGNFVYTVGTNNGVMYKIDMSNPVFPVLVSQVALIGGSSGAFSGVPAFPAAVPSHWDVYMVTDYSNDSQFTYILESTSGNIWKYDMNADAVVATFQSNDLIGMCPRAMVNGNLYFSFDGNRISQTGQTALNSYWNTGALVYLKAYSGFNASQITAYNISVSTANVWAMSFDAGSSTMWVTTETGNLIEVTIAPGTTGPTGTPVENPGIWNQPAGVFTNLCNTVIYNGIIYASSYGKGTYYIDLSDIVGGSTAFDALTTPSLNHFTFTPVSGKNYGILCYKAASGASVAKYQYDGSLITEITISGGNVYNIVPFDNTLATTPNGYC